MQGETVKKVTQFWVLNSWLIFEK